MLIETCWKGERNWIYSKYTQTLGKNNDLRLEFPQDSIKRY